RLEHVNNNVIQTTTELPLQPTCPHEIIVVVIELITNSLLINLAILQRGTPPVFPPSRVCLGTTELSMRRFGNEVLMPELLNARLLLSVSLKFVLFPKVNGAAP
uniref:Uncharacterized protein n=1 Tax=Triticum urartu TaxID=4572 RepID=A0A8R7UBG1_TRIUA